MILDKEGSVLTRIWCLFEAWHTGKKGPGALRLLCYGLDFNIFFRIFRNLTILRAEATVQSDLNMILDAIRDDVGIEALDLQLKRALVESLTGEIPSADEAWTVEIGARLSRAARMLSESGSIDEAEALLRRNIKGLEASASISVMASSSVEASAAGSEEASVSGSQLKEKEAQSAFLTALFEFASSLDQWGSVSRAEKDSERGKGRRAEALAIYQRIQREREACFGEDHPGVLEVMKRLAYLMQDLEDRGGAISLLRRLVDSSHADQDEMLALASLLSDEGGADEAARLEARAKKLPPRKFKFVPCATPGVQKFEVRSGSAFEIDERYTPVQIIGEGAFSIAVGCKDSEAGDETVAIKKISRAFDDTFESNRVLRETMIHSALSGGPCLVALKRIMKPLPLYKDSYDDLYIVVEHFESDLKRIIRSQQGLTSDHIRYLIAQLLLALQHVHSRGVAHNNVKPANVMVNADCTLGLGDFGSATTLRSRECSKDAGGASGDPGYVGTRWYRSPEKFTGKYDPMTAQSGDVWAVGCILGELMAWRPLFPGTSSIDVLRKIVAVTGKPLQEDLEDMGLNQKAIDFFAKLPDPGDSKALMSHLFPESSRAPEEAKDLLVGLLAFNPSKRLSAYGALKHPWIFDILEDEERLKVEATEAEGVGPLSFDWEGKVMVKADEARRILYDQAKKSAAAS